MRCLTRREIADYALGLSETETPSRLVARMHLAGGCEKCSRELQAMKALAASLREDDVWEEVPERVLKRAFDIFPAGADARAETGSRVGRRPQGVSRSRAAGRLRVYGPGFLVPQTATRSAESAPLPSGGTVQVVVRGHDVRGQVFDASREDLSGLTLELLDVQDSLVEQTTTDTLGRFVFRGLRPGTYTLVVKNHKGDARCRVDVKAH
ncbi:MAG: carboxypeptidase-like regulatory domain-containing protein [Firmicutes bacterium]|nr:carboxypeptidase-like regulatory domain-containing protein [Bacillota bacterium]MDH7495187.1 carboxypeptidase-like regulatory domain-containing protein [Bacillota bacterium]